MAETVASLDEIATAGSDLVAAVARLFDELGTSFGIAEMGQFSRAGEIRRRCWQYADDVLSWAERHDVGVVDDLAIDA